MLLRRNAFTHAPAAGQKDFIPAVGSIVAVATGAVGIPAQWLSWREPSPGLAAE